MEPDKSVQKATNSTQEICSICICQPYLPITLTCNHTLCYLCLKTHIISSNLCPVCRAKIPSDVLKGKQLGDIEYVDLIWLFEGTDGWWFYDEDANRAIEAAYAAKKSTVDVYITSNLYTVDFVKLHQRNKHGKVRKISRIENVDTKKIKGIAGLRRK